MSDQSQTTPAADGAAAAAPAKKKHKTVVLNRFSMKAPLPGVSGDISSTAYWGSYRGNPRLIIHTNDPEDAGNNYGKIVASMDIVTFQDLMQKLELVADSSHDSPNSKFKVDNKSTYKGDQRFETPQLVNSTIIGKDEDGRVWITVVEGSRRSPRFFFGPTEYHQVVRRDGSPLPAGEASQHMAKAVARALTGVMAVLAARAALGDEPDEEGNDAPKKEGGQSGGWQNRQGGGGWQNRQGGGGGGWRGNGGGGQGGGWRGGQGGGGGWRGNGGGGGGNWQNRQGGGGGWQNRQQGGGGGGAPAQAAASVSNDDIQF